MVLIILSKTISCALGALGRRFESCRPDSYSSGSQQYQKSVSMYPWKFPWIFMEINKSFYGSWRICVQLNVEYRQYGTTSFRIELI